MKFTLVELIAVAFTLAWLGVVGGLVYALLRFVAKFW